jgi:heme-degrading monooxygenase HmoA
MLSSSAAACRTGFLAIPANVFAHAFVNPSPSGGSAMYVKLRQGNILPGQDDEFVKKIREVTIPNYQKMAGYEGCHLFIDRQNSKAIFVSYWASEGDMRASEEDTGFRSQLDDVRSPPESSFYEVIDTA